MNEFCTNCGAALIDGVCPNCTQVNDEKYNQFFMNPKERLVTTLGNTYFQNFLYDGSIRKGFAVVSDKRVYFRGSRYEIATKDKGKKKMTHTKESRTVDIKDISGTGYERTSNPLYLLGFILSSLITLYLLIILWVV